MPVEATDQASIAAKTVYRFGEFELRTDTGELFRNGGRLRVQEQSVRVLLALLEKPGAVVTRDQLRERLWPAGTYVDFEHSLNAAVKRLRAALDDNAENPRYIETLPKRGYRLVVDVSRSTPPTLSAETLAGSPAKSARPVAVVVAVLALAAAAMLALFLRRHMTFAAQSVAGTAAPPQNSEAYELYLRSLGYKHEFPANGQAVALLERSTALDPNSARSWYELARRYNVEFTNAARGHAYFERAREANRRATGLAPDFAPPRVFQTILDVEGGEVAAAYHRALTMTREHPEDANARFALSYALRYGGMFEEAAGECDRALKLDPSNPRLQSCALVNVLLGRHDQVSAYLNLDALSSLTRFRRMDLAILRNDKTAALREVRAIRADGQFSPFSLLTASYADARLMEAALSGASPQAVRSWSREDEALNDRITLAELHFVDARYQSWAGQTDAALRLLRRAIANNYCSYPVMDSDPFLANIRRLPEYKGLRQAGIACRENFRLQMAKH